MCGIGGIALRPGMSYDVMAGLESMLNVQRHRGPDARDYWIKDDGAVGFCHNRLSILDLSDAGNQPMRSHDDRFTVVFNGEIYNYLELRDELCKHGCKFRTASDTEVLLEAYRIWGESMLTRLRGMFAFALYDRQSGEILCARDRVGKKPFVYAQTHMAFVFASEIPAVRCLPGVDSSFDHAAIAAMLLHNLRHIPDPHTAYTHIKRLRAGHAMVVRDGIVLRQWRYWIPQPTKSSISIAELRHRLEEAVNLRMRADVPVGALLSGGVDSSAIVALMQKFSPRSVHTYALGFDQRDEDLRRARVMAAHLKTNHREFYFDAREQWDMFQKLMNQYGEPIMLLPLLHTYALCRAIRDDGIKVVLTGNGADEIFYGYTGHIRTLKVSRFLDCLAPVRAGLSWLSGSRLGWVAAQPGHRKAEYYRSLARRDWTHCLAPKKIAELPNYAADEMDYWGGLCPSSHFIDESNFVGLMIENPHSVTIAGDLPAMAASVEIRSPFLDQEIIEFALATPAALKIPDTSNPDWLKVILREAVIDLVPDALLKAPKRGFGYGIQEADLLRGDWRDHAERFMMEPNTMGGLFSANAIRMTWQGFLDGKVPAIHVAKQLAIQTWLGNLH